ncbi:hypothetical protein NL676_035036 [Syzygium grande]|nr:hypothetical protein NL676_035036 [Syzygium grande]
MPIAPEGGSDAPYGIPSYYVSFDAPYWNAVIRVSFDVAVLDGAGTMPVILGDRHLTVYCLMCSGQEGS